MKMFIPPNTYAQGHHFRPTDSPYHRMKEVSRYYCRRNENKAWGLKIYKFRQQIQIMLLKQNLGICKGLRYIEYAIDILYGMEGNNGLPNKQISER